MAGQNDLPVKRDARVRSALKTASHDKGIIVSLRPGNDIWSQLRKILE